MNEYSKETLHRIEQNDLIELGICNKSDVLIRRDGRFFTSTDGGDYSRLGSYIGRNTNLKTLYVETDGIRLSATDSGFFEGLKQNSSIREFKISGYSPIINHNPLGEVGCELLKAFQENSSRLTVLRIWACDIGSVEELVISKTLSSCRNVKELGMNHNNMTDEQLLLMVESLRGHRSLEELRLENNRIGNTGCDALATLLEDANCNIHTLSLNNNNIGNEGMNTLANSLASNNKLKKLHLKINQFDKSCAENAFVRVLCDTSSINATYSSNHNLVTLVLTSEDDRETRDPLDDLLRTNEGTNMKNVAIDKILEYQPNFDVELLFEWGSEDERNLMALPYLIDWFDRASVLISNRYNGLSRRDLMRCYRNRDQRKLSVQKLSAIYEFSLAMPLLFDVQSMRKTTKEEEESL